MYTNGKKIRYKTMVENTKLTDFFEELKEWNNNTIVYLGVPNEYVLNLWVSKLEDKEKIYSCFIEPDLGDKITSIACVDTGEIFKSLRIV